MSLAQQALAELSAAHEFFSRSTRNLTEAHSSVMPAEGMMTAAQQLAHTAQTVEWFMEGAFRPEGFDLDFEKHAKATEACTSLAAARDWFERAMAAAKQRGIIVTNTPDVLNDCVADAAMALTLNVLRKYPQAEAYLRSGYWGTRGDYPLTTSLGGKTMGVLGLGRIGEAIARRALAFGMKIRYHNRHRKDVPYEYDADAVALARNSDVLMIATPGGAGTKAMYATLITRPRGSRPNSPKVYSCSRYTSDTPVSSRSSRRAAVSSDSSMCTKPPGTAHFPRYGTRSRLMSSTCNSSSRKVMMTTSTVTAGF